ncbi:MAG: mycofactocin system FadH/OYE family oxidoreductase 1 [Acidimicrobiales bacterium]|nr:mycofactocin system FadH/OYE family oxidoreductase 1 [Acidimicrobiales bacterium]
MTSLLENPLDISGHVAPSRVVFGPHETNLGDGRAFSDRHVAYYARRARGGAGLIVTETASVTPNDWPYERAPLASEARAGWEAVAGACASHGTLVLAGLGHAGGQGSSAFSQEVMWAPSRVADVVSREPPAELDEEGISEIVEAFGAAAAGAVDAGLTGVEIDAGAWSLLRQFHSGLTNLRDDRYGTDRLLFTRLVLAAARRAVGPSGLVTLRLSCDELAPWAGITPDQASQTVGELAGLVDVLTVVRAGPYATSAYRPDAHTPAGFNLELCRQMHVAAGGQATVVLQGSIVDVAMAQAALDGGVCDLVEMTRALIADAELVSRVRSGQARSVRPCIRCNQACLVRDNRNPLVSCVMDPASGHETEEPYSPGATSGAGPEVLVVGAGPAGLECARILAEAGRSVRVADRAAEAGGMLVRAARGPGRESLRLAASWLAEAAAAAGARLCLSTPVSREDVERARADGWQVVLATGSRPVQGRYAEPGGVPVVDAVDALERAEALPDGPVVVVDPVGNQVAVNLAEWLAVAFGRQVTLVCPDPVAGTQLSRTGDLAGANVRLERAGVRRQLRSVVRSVSGSVVSVEDCWTGQATDIPGEVVIDCGHRVADDELYVQLSNMSMAGAGPSVARAGDCVAPRTLLEAILEGRRVALQLLASPVAVGVRS